MPKKYDPHPCPICNTITINKKFCSLRCTNKSFENNIETHCKVCSKLIGVGWRHQRTKYCKDCFSLHAKCCRDWSKTTIEQHFKNLPNFQANSRIRKLARDNYKKSGKPKECLNCKYNKFFEVCHIKPISSFDRSTSIATVNHIDNLVALCPNCHWELDNRIITLSHGA